MAVAAVTYPTFTVGTTILQNQVNQNFADIIAVLNGSGNGSIAAGSLATGAVTAGKIAAGGVSASNQFAVGVVDANALGASAVTAPKRGLPAIGRVSTDLQGLTTTATAMVGAASIADSSNTSYITVAAATGKLTAAVDGWYRLDCTATATSVAAANGSVTTTWMKNGVNKPSGSTLNPPEYDANTSVVETSTKTVVHHLHTVVKLTAADFIQVAMRCGVGTTTSNSWVLWSMEYLGPIV